MEKQATITKNKIVIFLFLAISFIFSLPSILYLLQNGTIYEFNFVWTYFFKIQIPQCDKLLNAIVFFILFSFLFGIYFSIIKRRKQLFRNKNQIIAFIAIISTIFLIVIPYASKDVYSYIANGWSAAHYKKNPYYVSTGQIADNTGINDSMFYKVANCWKYEKVVYGPLWTLICTILSWISFGNIDNALLIFKLSNFVIHIVNCILIYKITKKDLYILLYGLNPFVLFEALSNVHNDIYIVFFILLAIYFAVKRKNLFLSVAFIAMATAIKYLPILILPFLVIYCVRHKDVKDRFKYCIYCGIEYISIIGLLYMIYLKDFNVFLGIFIQQQKYNSSVFYLLYEWIGKDNKVISSMKNIALGLFAIDYIYVVVRLLFSKKVILSAIIQKYNLILMIFTFVLITNFNSWYIMWFFPTIFYLKGKNIKNILYLSYTSEIANLVSFVLFSKIPYFITMSVMAIILNRINDKKLKLGFYKNSK